jgi:hypothetical protein
MSSEYAHFDESLAILKAMQAGLETKPDSLHQFIHLGERIADALTKPVAQNTRKIEDSLARVCAEYLKKCHVFLEALLTGTLASAAGTKLTPAGVKAAVIAHSNKNLQEQGQIRALVDRLSRGTNGL